MMKDEAVVDFANARSSHKQNEALARSDSPGSLLPSPGQRGV